MEILSIFLNIGYIVVYFSRVFTVDILAMKVRIVSDIGELLMNCDLSQVTVRVEAAMKVVLGMLKMDS